MRRRVTVGHNGTVFVAAVLTVGLAFAAPAAAATPHLTLSPASGPAGTTVVARGTGFCPSPCTAVEIDFSTLVVAPAVKVSANGTFRATFNVPDGTVPGVNNVAATQNDSTGTTRQATANFAIRPSQPPPNVTTSPTTAKPTNSHPVTKTTSTTPGSPTTRSNGTPSTSAPRTEPTSTTHHDGTTSSSTTTLNKSATNAPGETGSGSPGALPWILALIVVAALGGGAWYFVRRRRRQSAS
jgi:hypothetical protein